MKTTIQFYNLQDLVDFEKAFYAHEPFLGGNCTWNYKQLTFKTNRGCLKQEELNLAKLYKHKLL